MMSKRNRVAKLEAKTGLGVDEVQIYFTYPDNYSGQVPDWYIKESDLAQVMAERGPSKLTMVLNCFGNPSEEKVPVPKNEFIFA